MKARITMRSVLCCGYLITGLLCTATAPASAQQERPIQLSLVAPIQIFPEADAIKGFRFNLIYGRNAAMSGFDLGFVNHVTGPMTGVQWGFVNVTNAFVGWQDALVNLNKGAFEGFQSGGVNTTGSMNGLQFGLVNYAEQANGCLQIGLVNIIKQGGTFPVMIIVNWGGL